MGEPEITRSQFLRGGSCLAAGAILSTAVVPETACGRQCDATGTESLSPCGPSADGLGTAMRLRPYQILCIVCSLGEDPPGPIDVQRTALIEAIRKEPDMPICLVCNAGDVYTYQDPGTADDTPEGRDFNRKRDLDILQRMSWPPGTILPARAVFHSILKQIPTVVGLCGYDTATSEGWTGCPKTKSGNYEQGRNKGIDAIIPPRAAEELAREKKRSVEALHTAHEVTIRPHILLCAVCQYGNGVRPPFPDDNLPDLLDMILHQNPHVLVKMARGRLADVRSLSEPRCGAECLCQHTGIRRPLQRKTGPRHASAIGSALR